MYLDLRELPLSASAGPIHFEISLKHLVNDGLMALFFFVLGLELKRELMVGQLGSLRQASSVVFAALGGMIMPAVIFLLVAESEAVRSAWAVPVATDTAFALLVLVLLGKRIPATARTFLVGLAIVDDLGAIILIALAYTRDFSAELLSPTLATLALLVIMNRLGVRNGLLYFTVGVVLWWLVSQLGFHGTVAGVLVALAAPVRAAIPRTHFIAKLRQSLRQFRADHSTATESILEQPEQHDIAEEVLQDAARATVPLKRWESSLGKPINLVIMPLFAFVNAGVSLSASSIAAALKSELCIAIFLGLLVGKLTGIFCGTWLGLKSGLSDLPEGLSLRHVFGIAIVGSIGFTMSLLIATLAFGEDSKLLETATQGIILTSLCGGLLGFAWLRSCPRAS
jgi:NhaA family Na+:H+ antiporter